MTLYAVRYHYHDPGERINPQQRWVELRARSKAEAKRLAESIGKQQGFPAAWRVYEVTRI